MKPKAPPLPSPSAISPALLCWYDKNARVLAWRAQPGCSSDPYKVWLSEIMLQQTTVATVKSYFEAFIGRWGDVHALARAELDDVLAAWAGLGYYARARNLHACARIISEQHDGIFPKTAAELMDLPGIGPYTAAAIAAIAHDEPVAAVDGNVERVVSRLYAITTPLPHSKPEIKQRAKGLVPERRAGDFAQALMDLGALVCIPRAPLCDTCPLLFACQARRDGLERGLPAKGPKASKPTRFGRAFVVQRADGAILLRKRPPRGLLGGMLEVPMSPWSRDDKGKRNAANTVKHTFTHFHLVLSVEKSDDYSAAEVRDTSANLWVAQDALADQALPTVIKKVLVKALGADVFNA